MDGAELQDVLVSVPRETPLINLPPPLRPAARLRAGWNSDLIVAAGRSDGGMRAARRPANEVETSLKGEERWRRGEVMKDKTTESRWRMEVEQLASTRGFVSGLEAAVQTPA